MSKYSNLPVPKIIKNPTPKQRIYLDKLAKEMEATDEDRKEWREAILRGEVGYIDGHGKPQMYSR